MPEAPQAQAGATTSATGRPTVAATPSSVEAQAFVARSCVTCHNPRLKTANLVLEGLEVATAAAHPEVWEKVLRKVSVDAMPPPGSRQPQPDLKRAFIAALEGQLDTSYVARRNPGRSLVHRLNRTEYGNAIRELLDLDVDVASLLPADSASYGFDNISNVLTVSPILLSRYLTAAEKISSIAVGDPEIASEEKTFSVAKDLSQNQPAPGMPPGTMGGLAITHNFPLSADYVLRGKLWETLGGGVRGMEGEVNPYFFEITVDGKRVHLAPIGGAADSDIAHDDSGRAIDVANGRMQIRVPLTAGPHKVTFGFLDTMVTTQENLQPGVRAPLQITEAFGAPKIKWAYITGPMNATGPGDTPSRRRIFICRPRTTADEVPCAAKILGGLARACLRTASDYDGDAGTRWTVHEGASVRIFRSGHSTGAATDPDGLGIPLPQSSRAASSSGGCLIPDQRFGIGDTIGLIPVEQYS